MIFIILYTSYYYLNETGVIIELTPDLLPARLHSSVVEHHTGIAEVMGSNPVGASEFFLGFICNCLSCFTTAKISFTSIIYNVLKRDELAVLTCIFGSPHALNRAGFVPL